MVNGFRDGKDPEEKYPTGVYGALDPRGAQSYLQFTEHEGVWVAASVSGAYKVNERLPCARRMKREPDNC